MYSKSSYTYCTDVRNINFSTIFEQISTKVGRKMGRGTLTTEKILRSGYLGNGCYGDEKNVLNYQIFH